LQRNIAYRKKSSYDAKLCGAGHDPRITYYAVSRTFPAEALAGKRPRHSDDIFAPAPDRHPFSSVEANAANSDGADPVLT